MTQSVLLHELLCWQVSVTLKQDCGKKSIYKHIHIAKMAQISENTLVISGMQNKGMTIEYPQNTLHEKPVHTSHR